jgi:hypothetical protein
MRGLSSLFLAAVLALAPALLHAGWPDGGFAISNGSGNQVNPRITSDGHGGALITWQSTSGNGHDIYAQRVSGDGVVLWQTGGVCVCDEPGDQIKPQIAPDGSGGAIITWEDYRNGNPDIFAQRVDAAGNVRWTAGGVGICVIGVDYRLYQYDPKIASDGAGGAIIVWDDENKPPTDPPTNYPDYDYNIYVQRIDSTGAALWGDAGKAITSHWVDCFIDSRIVSDGSGGAFISYVRYYPHEPLGDKLYVVRLDSTGAVTWSNKVYDDFLRARHEYLSRDGSGGLIIVFNCSSIATIQRLDEAGNSYWEPGGLLLRANSYFPLAVPDGSGGAIVSWNGGGVQRVDSAGTCLWNDKSFSSSGRPGGMIPYGNGSSVVIWSEGMVKAQMLNEFGDRNWSPSGVLLSPNGSNQHDPGIILDDAGGAIAAWQDGRSGVSQIYVTRIDYFSDMISLDPIGDREVYTGDTLRIQLGAYDPVGTVPLVYSSDADVALPSPATLDENAGLFTWIPAQGDEGEYAVTFRVTNGTYYDSERITISVYYDSTRVPVRLRDFSATRDGNAIKVIWTLNAPSDPVAFRVSRRSSSEGRYIELHGMEITRRDLTWSFKDDGCRPGETYSYKVEYSSPGGRSLLFETEPIRIPEIAFALYPNQPNPFKGETKISYYLPSPTKVRLDVFDVSGRLIAHLVDGFQGQGHRSVTWNGKNDTGQVVSAGVYFCRLRAYNNRSLTRKMIMLK